MLSQIDTLRNSLQYTSAGENISFDDYYLKLQEQVDNLPKLKLETIVATGTENQYIMQLIKAMEEIVDKSDVLVRKVIHYQSKLKNAQGQIKKLSAAFNAWYTLGASELLESNDVKFPSNQLKDLANSEYSRLMKNTDMEIDSLLAAVAVQNEQIKNWKKTQQEKFNFGKDQANASWTSSLPNFGEAPERSDQLLARPKFVQEEEDEEVPQFVSKKPTVVPKAAPEPIQLSNHPSLNDPLVLGDTHAIELGPETSEIKGTFFKRGDAQPLTPIATDTGKPPVVTLPHVSVALPFAAQEVLSDPKATPEEIKEAFAQEIVTPDPNHAPPTADLAAKAPTDFTNIFPNAVEILPPAAAPKAVAKPKKAAATYQLPGENDQIVLRDSDPAEKIKCVVCDRRIKSKQEMFQRDGRWAHVNEGECTGAPTVHRVHHDDVDEPGGVMACSPEILKASGVSVEEAGTPEGQAAISAAAFGSMLARPNPSPGMVQTGTLLADLEQKAATTTLIAADKPVNTPDIGTTPAIPAAPDAPATPRKRLTFLEEDQEIL